MKLARMEARLFVREPVGLFFGLFFPALILVGLGYLFPGFAEPAAELDGSRFIDVYPPLAISFGLAMLGLGTIPPTLANYRQFGILRRLRTTPLDPGRLLLALMLVQIVVAVVAGVAVIVVARLAFSVPIPEQSLWFVLSWLLTGFAMFATGLLIGSISGSSQAAIAIGMAVFFPLLFFAGLWIPRDMMSDTLRALSDFTPLGAAVQAMTDAWYGTPPGFLHLAVLLAYSILIGFLAIRLFRWE